MLMNQQEQIVFIGEYQFPEGDAAAIRTMSLARICRDLGYGVTVVGKGKLRPQDYQSDSGTHSVEGIKYLSMNPKRVTISERLRHPIRRLRLYPATLEAQDHSRTRAVVINACDSAIHVPGVMAFCRRHSIPLIGDVCEWYDPRQKNYG